MLTTTINPNFRFGLDLILLFLPGAIICLNRKATLATGLSTTTSFRRLEVVGKGCIVSRGKVRSSKTAAEARIWRRCCCRSLRSLIRYRLQPRVSAGDAEELGLLTESGERWS